MTLNGDQSWFLKCSSIPITSVCALRNLGLNWREELTNFFISVRFSIPSSRSEHAAVMSCASRVVESSKMFDRSVSVSFQSCFVGLLLFEPILGLKISNTLDVGFGEEL